MVRQHSGIGVRLASLAACALMLAGFEAVPSGQSPPSTTAPQQPGAGVAAGDAQGTAHITGQA